MANVLWQRQTKAPAQGPATVGVVSDSTILANETKGNLLKRSQERFLYSGRGHQVPFFS